MIPLHSLLIYCGIYAIAIAVPGPGIVAIVARALGSGFRSTIPAVIGNTVGDLILMTLSAFGLALVAQAMGHLFLIVKIAGALYLLLLDEIAAHLDVTRRAALFEEIAALGAQAWMTGTDLSLFTGACAQIFEVQGGTFLEAAP